MLRITEYIRLSLQEKNIRPASSTILILNLTNACNLRCQHCYANALQPDKNELTTQEIQTLAPELHKNNIKFAILSGGEPLLRKDIFQIAQILKQHHILPYLSTNGLLIQPKNIHLIAQTFPYVGISIDGNPQIHDTFRGKKGAFQKSLNAISLCLQHHIKLGLRFTLTPLTLPSLPFLFQLAEEKQIPKIYISHLVHSGRANQLSTLTPPQYQHAIQLILQKAFSYAENHTPIDIVTGNNETDAVFLLHEFHQRYPQKTPQLLQLLLSWGGNQAGKRLVNIDHKGNVKPDPFFPISVGNIRKRRFHQIWNTHPLLQQLRQTPRKLKGKCQQCPYLNLCNGNSRARAYTTYQDLWQEDPFCYASSLSSIPLHSWQKNSTSSNENAPASP